MSIQTITNKKNVTLGIFTAIHTFGHDLKRNVHVDLSTIQGVLTKDLNYWKNLYFKQSILIQL